MTKFNLLVAIVVAIGISGCATSSINYAPPAEPKIQNSKSSKQSFDAVWDELVKQLSSDFFVINNIDKNSRLINLSFSSQKPSDYVDCGVTNRTFKNARGEQTYTYNTADSSTFTTATSSGGAFHVKRAAKLEGRTNIYVAPEGAGTLISVNTKYVVTVNINAVQLNGNPGGSDVATFDFSTKQGFNNGEVTCYARGSVEQRILGLIK